MLKHKILVLILTLTITSPVFSEPESMQGILPQAIQKEQMGTIEPLDQTKQNTVEELPSPSQTISYKQPESRRKVAKKFLLAMSGVAISSILLFLILTIYNKMREVLGFGQKEVLPKEDMTSLTTPDNLEDAVRTFLEKTKWDK